MYTFKLTHEQRLKLIGSGYTLKEIQDAVKRDIPGAITLKICFSDEETLEWMKKRYPKKLSIDEVFEWWTLHAKTEFTRGVSMSGLYKAYEDRRELRKPLIMYKEMAVDNKPHRIY